MNIGSSNGTSSTLFTQTSEFAIPVTHSALHFFEQPTVIINYECSFDQEVFPHMDCRGPQLDFVVSAEKKNCIDLNSLWRCAFTDQTAKTKLNLQKLSSRLQITFYTLYFHMWSSFWTKICFPAATIIIINWPTSKLNLQQILPAK